jgi:predicted transcriptional regulator
LIRTPRAIADEALAPPTAEVEQAWAVEIERRLREIDSGTAVVFDGEQVFAELRAKYAR